MKDNPAQGMVGSLREFAPYFALLKGVRLQFAAALLLGVVCGVTSGFGFPFMMYKVFPAIFEGGAPDLLSLLGIVSLLPAVFLVRGVSAFGSGYLSSFCEIHVQNRIKSDLFEKLQRLPLAYFARNRIGDIMARVKADSAVVQKVSTVVFNDLIKQAVTFLGAIAYLVYMAIQNHQMMFVLFSLGIVPVCTLPIRHVGRKILDRAQHLQRTDGDISAVLLENLVAVREVRAFNLQDREQAKFRDHLHRMARYGLKAAKYTHSLPALIEFISAVGISVAVVYTSRTAMGFEAVLPLLAALYMSYDPIKKLSGLQTQVKRGQASIQRIEDILHAEETIRDPERPVPFDPDRTDIEFDGVTFSYGQEPVLKDIRVSIPKGSVVALVGPSGAGKSTFVNLLPRFYDVGSGVLRVGGHDIRTYALHALRRNISLISQETILFRDTIRNNIRLGRLDATDAEVEAAARLSFAHDFILGFPQGYETNAGERGMRLSGGQKQRIAIARAFLKNAPILVMDEATSSLDSESEDMIQQALGRLIQGKTVLIIAHRFSTIKTASRILVFDQGVIRAAGTHQELFDSDELYRRLYEHQFVS